MATYAYIDYIRGRHYPHEFFELSLREKATVIAFIDFWIENEKKQRKQRNQEI